MSDRVARLIDIIEGREKLQIGGSSACLLAELRLMGKDAVPVLIEHVPTDDRFLLGYILVLGGIGDDRAVDYMIRAMKKLPPRDLHERCEAIEALSRFPMELVITFLVDELRDESAVPLDRCIHQRGRSGDEPCVWPFYQIQSCAARALNVATGRNWGTLFNEDYRTWAAWRDSADRNNFNPLMLARDDRELRELARKLLCQEMLPGIDSSYGWWSEEGSVSEQVRIGARLRILDSQGVSVVLAEYAARLQFLRSDEERENVRTWVETILRDIGTPDAEAAEKALFGW